MNSSAFLALRVLPHAPEGDDLSARALRSLRLRRMAETRGIRFLPAAPETISLTFQLANVIQLFALPLLHSHCY